MTERSTQDAGVWRWQIECDAGPCGFLIEGTAATSGGARQSVHARAFRRGWRRAADGCDYCPGHGRSMAACDFGDWGTR